MNLTINFFFNQINQLSTKVYISLTLETLNNVTNVKPVFQTVEDVKAIIINCDRQPNHSCFNLLIVWPPLHCFLLIGWLMYSVVHFDPHLDCAYSNTEVEY